jgi:iron complex outermembrane recepter protein
MNVHMKKIMLSVLVYFISLTVFAQSNGTITGAVTATGGKAYAAATIELRKATDSAIVKITVSGEDGKFAFENISNGNYLVAVSATGHIKAYSNKFEVNGGSVNVSTITLTAQTTDLKSVTIVARKPLVEQKIDRMVVNVDAAVSNVGATALEVLEKSPGITVDKDGNISLKGKQGVQVFVDGKPSYLSGAELVNLLRNMNANQLDQIEIMTNPPAKYDAAGNSGIINLKTKKNKVKGFNGSVTAGYSQGVYWRTNESLNMNYRNGRFNAFMNYSYNKNNSYQELTIHRTYRQADGKTISALFDQVAFMPKNNSSNNLKLGMDYFLSKKTTIGFVTSGFINPSQDNNFNTSNLKNAAGAIDSIVKSSTVSNEKWKNGSVNLNFRHQFDSTGRELTADLDYSTYQSDNDQLFRNTSYQPDMVKKGQTDLKGDLPVDISIYSAKMDYTHPFKTGLKLEAGIKSSYVNTDNAANYFMQDGLDWNIDYSKTNRFQYKENINAAYVNLSKQIKKFGIQAGLRFENTNYKGHQFGNVQRPDSSFSNTYNSLFPTVYISYNADKNNQFGLSVGRRIDRPAYQDLNPFLFFLDNYTYQAGNPFLKPQYSNNLELSHTFKGFLTTTVNYSKTKNFFTETFEQKGYATIVRQGNIGLRENAGISVSAQVPVAKWWSSSLYTNYNYSSFEGELYGEPIRVKASNILFNVNNQFSFNKGWGAELSGFYRSKGVEGQIVIEPMGQVSAGVSKQVLKGKGSVRANIRDIFFTSWVKGYINFQQTEARFENRRDARVASISFTYRFGKPLKNASQRKKGGASEEQERVKIGG